MSSKLANTVAAKALSNMYLESELADVHFVFPNDKQAEKLPAHRAIFATTSPVFKAMFYGPLKEADVVQIKDSTASVFKEFMQFFYLPEVTLSIENIEAIVGLADKYDMMDCFDTCAAFLEANLTTENMVWGYQLAITLNNAQLMAFCEKHIQMCIGQIMTSEMFLHCSHDIVAHILKLNTLACDEKELFDACIEWAKASCQKNGLDETDSENLKHQLGPCFYSIRFSAMEAQELANVLQNKTFEGMFTRDELADIWRAKWIQEPKSDFFNLDPRSNPVCTWDTYNKLVSTRTVQSRSTTYYIQQQESTWFSSHEFILLGEIVFVSLNYNYNYPSFNINIVEHDKDNFMGNTSNKVLYTMSNIQTHSPFLLSKPIIIRPHKMYEIRLQKMNNNHNDGYHSSLWVTPETINLDEKINIKFHQNPADNNSTCRGLVSSLNFNRIV